MNYSRRRLGFTLVEGLVVIAILTVLMGITIPAIQRVRDVSYRAQCASQLRQLGVALQGFHTIHGRLPSGAGGVSSQQPHLSWIAQILPQLDRDDLWLRTQQAFATDRWPFRNPPHVALDVIMPVLNCPADGRSLLPKVTRRGFPVAFTCYLGVSGDWPASHNGVLFRDSRVTAHEIADGLSHTIAAGERPPSSDFIFGWWYAGTGSDGEGTGDYLLNAINYNELGGTSTERGPFGFRPGRVDNSSDSFHFWSLHYGGAHFLFIDGSTRFLSYSAAKIVPALATRAGNEAVELP